MMCVEKMKVSDEFCCTLCLKLLFKPSTTICGHSFCQRCLSKALVHKAKCPICRCVINAEPNKLAVATDLHRLLEISFSEEYSLRKIEDEELAAQEEEQQRQLQTHHLELPVMVVCPVLPGQRLHLHIYEPRYRVMVQRCLEGSRRFGIMPRTFQRFYLYGCEVEILECETLPGGRYYLEVVGRRVFRIGTSSGTSEYLSCSVSWIDLECDSDYDGQGNIIQVPIQRAGFVEDRDSTLNRGFEVSFPLMETTSPMSVAPSEDNIIAMSSELSFLVERWQALVYENGYERTPDQLRRICRELGPMPGVMQPGKRAMWVAALINPVPALGVAPEIRTKLLSAQTVEKRLDIVTIAIKNSIAHMTPVFGQSWYGSVVKRAVKAGAFLFRNAWLIILGWWLAQQFPNSLPRSIFLNAVKTFVSS